MTKVWAICLALSATPLWGGEVTSVDYAELAGHLPGLVDFEGFAPLPEPGQPLPGLVHFHGVTLGSMLAGQTRHVAEGFEMLTGHPSQPLAAQTGNKAAPIAVAFHAAFGSNAAFPIGPDGFERLSGRGEGALAFVFEQATPAFAIRLHADYPDPLGTRPKPGRVTFSFFDQAGDVIGQHTLLPDHGVNEVAVLITPAAQAITVTHRDPGGIAVDDIRFSIPGLVN
ncbi:hypothetical protein GCM10016455_10840 [Aliiroseovarius zhejiangensis]|uniref:Uncharacterized protein n=1 Tax=Aliiroseovarius zhejiangensis TaxID=1632025 RepID=A0ABQ3IUT0_9RHOB|nr:hypothetical protein [Aliiroseovarius zhejiangensis]GHE92624.1 hypothetical protein GCM10016455_10840 [Aliiroseovarius zhejiangensis]